MAEDNQLNINTQLPHDEQPENCPPYAAILAAMFETAGSAVIQRICSESKTLNDAIEALRKSTNDQFAALDPNSTLEKLAELEEQLNKFDLNKDGKIDAVVTLQEQLAAAQAEITRLKEQVADNTKEIAGTKDQVINLGSQLNQSVTQLNNSISTIDVKVNNAVNNANTALDNSNENLQKINEVGGKVQGNTQLIERLAETVKEQGELSAETINSLITTVRCEDRKDFETAAIAGVSKFVEIINQGCETVLNDSPESDAPPVDDESNDSAPPVDDESDDSVPSESEDDLPPGSAL